MARGLGERNARLLRQWRAAVRRRVIVDEIEAYAAVRAELATANHRERGRILTRLRKYVFRGFVVEMVIGEAA